MLGIQANTSILFLQKVRQIISYHLDLEAIEVFDGCIELDESYVDGVRKGKRGRSVAGIVIVFGNLKRGVYVYNIVVVITKTITLRPVKVVK